MGTADKSEPLPETPEDSRFLLDIPEDFNYDAAVGKIREAIGSSVMSEKEGMVRGAEVVVAVKQHLGLTGYAGNSAATRVILNVVDEVSREYGAVSAEIVVGRLRTRRLALQMAATGKGEKTTK